MRRSLLVIAATVCVAGCHTFHPTSVADLTPGEDIRARITGAFSDSLSTILGGDTRIVEGSYVESTRSSVFIDIPVSSAYRGMRLQTLSQRVEVPTTAFLELERKQRSRARTGLALGAAVTASIAIIISQLSGDTGGGVPPGGGGPVDAVVSTPSVSLGNLLAWVWSR